MKTEKVNLCKCNLCGQTLIDENPQVDAKKYDIDISQYGSLIYYPDHHDEEVAWICPKCMTDSFLTDL